MTLVKWLRGHLKRDLSTLDLTFTQQISQVRACSTSSVVILCNSWSHKAGYQLSPLTDGILTNSDKQM